MDTNSNFLKLRSDIEFNKLSIPTLFTLFANLKYFLVIGSPTKPARIITLVFLSINFFIILLLLRSAFINLKFFFFFK